MSNPIKNQITQKKFAQRKTMGLFYVGFVAYTLGVANKPAYIGIYKVTILVPPRQNRYQYVKMKILDTPDKATS